MSHSLRDFANTIKASLMTLMEHYKLRLLELLLFVYNLALIGTIQYLIMCDINFIPNFKRSTTQAQYH